MKLAVLVNALAIVCGAVASSDAQQAHAIQSLQQAQAVVASTKAMTASEVVSATVDSDDSFDEESAEFFIGNSAVLQKAAQIVMDRNPYKGSMYFDERGAKVVGHGRNIDKDRNGGITEQEAKDIMMSHVAHFSKLLYANAPWTKQLDEVRRGALLNMSFQMGVGSAQRGTGVLGFRTAMAHMKNGHFTSAARALGGSNWSKQTPNRYRRIAKQIETGQWVVDGRRTPMSGGMEENLFAQLRVDEGYRPYAYKCSMGYWTFGIGNLIDAKKGGKITKDEAEMLVHSHVKDLLNELKDKFSWFTKLSEVRQVAMIQIAYKISMKTLLTMTSFTNAMAASKWDSAVANFNNSAYAKQAPAKARFMADMIKTNEYPSRALSSFEAAVEEPAVAFLPELEEESFDAEAEHQIRM